MRHFILRRKLIRLVEKGTQILEVSVKSVFKRTGSISKSEIRVDLKLL